MKCLNKILITFIVCLSILTPAFAHSGKTDSSGGHKDNKNVSGLGGYHYHHGYSAHLHTNGVCPYDTSANSSSSNLSGTNTSVAISKKTSVSDIKAYINSNFILSFNFNGHTYIIAEDLSNYGFDVKWNSQDRTLEISKNNEKTVVQNESSNPYTEYTIEDTDIKTYLWTASGFELLESFNIGGQTIIKLADLSENLNWDNNARTVYIDC